MPRSRTLNFDAELWHGHISIRALSLAARGLLIDMASIMDRNNELRFVTGDQITSANIANFSGIDVENVLLILEELKTSGAITIEDGKPIRISAVFKHKATRKAKQTGKQ